MSTDDRFALSLDITIIDYIAKYYHVSNNFPCYKEQSFFCDMGDGSVLSHDLRQNRTVPHVALLKLIFINYLTELEDADNIIVCLYKLNYSNLSVRFILGGKRIVENIKQKMMEFLLNNADPSIVLRTKKEILNQISEKEEEELLTKITIQKNVQTVIKSQKPDGWFGNNFHGSSGQRGAGMYDNMEVGIRFLAEKGFTNKHPILRKAMDSLLRRDELDPDYHNCGTLKNDYEHACQGLHLSRSSILLRAGFESELPVNEKINLKFDISYSLKSFLYVLGVKSIDVVLDDYKDVKVFKPKLLWPCIYDLRMLAFSNGWRNDENIYLLVKSIDKLFDLPQGGISVYNKINHALKAPCGHFIHRRILPEKDGFNVSSFWLDNMELFARCGVVQKVNKLKKEIEWLTDVIDKETGICRIAPDNYLWKYGPYSGLALEESPKTLLKRQCDVTFRALLIIYYSNLC